MEKKKKKRERERELKKSIHQLKHFKVDQASFAHNHKFFITIRIRFIPIPMSHSSFLACLKVWSLKQGNSGSK